MDISILLALQNFREGVGGFLAGFMQKMTFYGERSTIIAIMAIIYWCVNKDLGNYLLLGFAGNRLLNGFLKITFCIYRPWIRDPRIAPYGDAIKTAGGYSFPSGHTMNASTLFGGLSLRKEVSKSGRAMLIIATLLVGLSRLFLGVHTPQDVLVGLCLGLCMMFFTLKLTEYISKNPGKDTLVFCMGFVISVLIVVYSLVKKYPQDYDAHGKLIVDGAKMAMDSLKGVGYAMGIIAGWYLERRFVRFNTDISLGKRIGRGIFGLISYYVVCLIIAPVFNGLFPGAIGSVLSCFLQLFYVTFIFPLFMKLFEN